MTTKQTRIARQLAHRIDQGALAPQADDDLEIVALLDLYAKVQQFDLASEKLARSQTQFSNRRWLFGNFLWRPKRLGYAQTILSTMTAFLLGLMLVVQSQFATASTVRPNIFTPMPEPATFMAVFTPSPVEATAAPVQVSFQNYTPIKQETAVQRITN